MKMVRKVIPYLAVGLLVAVVCVSIGMALGPLYGMGTFIAMAVLALLVVAVTQGANNRYERRQDLRKQVRRA